MHHYGEVSNKATLIRLDSPNGTKVCVCGKLSKILATFTFLTNVCAHYLEAPERVSLVFSKFKYVPRMGPH